jgi:hypothetical protein
MKPLMKSMTVLAFCMLAGAAAGQQTSLPGGVPLNQIMPQLPPVPAPGSKPPQKSHRPCADARSQVPLGDTTVASNASRTPNGIGLYGGEGPDNDSAVATEDSTPCPPQ